MSGALLVEQVKHYLSSCERLHIVREIVGSVIHNLHRILEKREFEEEVNFLKKCEEELKKTSSINELMLIEAKARRKYYSTFERITGWEFEERTFRPPENPLNALISFGNAMLYTAILNPIISYLYEPSERRFSLALDIAEIFKPILVDKLVFRLINNKVIKISHFLKDLNFSYLSEEGRKIFVKNFDEMLENTILHCKLRRKVKYKTLIRLELYKLIKHLLGEKKFKALRVWW
ncbi:MAG: CRISPR-associated endonuclease Cas1 [Candidatus Aenigmatarchaeota archaeon]